MTIRITSKTLRIAKTKKNIYFLKRLKEVVLRL